MEKSIVKSLGAFNSVSGSSKVTKIVPSLPQSGEEGILYGVVMPEETREGYGIIQYFSWYNNDWYAEGAYSLDIAPTGIVYEQSFDTTTNTWTVTVS